MFPLKLPYIEVAMLRKDLTGFMYYSICTKIILIQLNAGRFIILIERKSLFLLPFPFVQTGLGNFGRPEKKHFSFLVLHISSQ